MSATLLSVEATIDPERTVAVEVVIPVHNEQAGLEESVRRLHGYLASSFPLTAVITIADNASRDHTWGIACRLAKELHGVRAVRLDAKGRGQALRAVWSQSTAPVVAYMDVDLSTDLDALLPLVAPLLSGHSDIAIGSRLARGARVVRGPKREVISRSYNLILKATLHNGFSDAQCGFKAMRTSVARVLLPLVEDNGWFFDTELLVLAEHNGLRIHEVPVDWVDDPDSRVHVRRTAAEDLAGVWRLLCRFAAGEGALPAGSVGSAAVTALDTFDAGVTGQLLRFTGIGVASTLLFAALFLLLVGPLGAIPADVVALGICGVVNIVANRRVTFAQRGKTGRRRQFAAGLTVAALPLVASVAVLGAMTALGAVAVGLELAALTAVNAAVAGLRLVLLRRWVFGADARPRGLP